MAVVAVSGGAHGSLPGDIGAVPDLAVRDHVGVVLGCQHLQVAHGAHGLVEAEVQTTRQCLVALLVVPDQLLQGQAEGVQSGAADTTPAHKCSSTATVQQSVKEQCEQCQTLGVASRGELT